MVKKMPSQNNDLALLGMKVKFNTHLTHQDFGEITCTLGIAKLDQINAPTHPNKVQPKNTFNINMPATLG